MARMLVRPQRTRDGLPVGCTGATMEDGTVYRADRRGHFEVDDVGHAKAMLRNPLAEGEVVEAKFHGAALGGVTCGGCGRSGFRWQKSRPCSKCGADDWRPEKG